MNFRWKFSSRFWKRPPSNRLDAELIRWIVELNSVISLVQNLSYLKIYGFGSLCVSKIIDSREFEGNRFK